MKFELTKTEKKNIVMEYGASLGTVTRLERILNNLDIVDDYDDFLEIICESTIEFEGMKYVDPSSSIKRSKLSEIMASVICIKYNDYNVSPEKAKKIKFFVFKHSNLGQ